VEEPSTASRRDSCAATKSGSVNGIVGLEKHPDKTFIGRIERGFDFLGYHFGPAELAVAKRTIANFIEKASRLYEQERSTVSAAAALEMYVRRWLSWPKGGMQRETLKDRTEESKVQHHAETSATFNLVFGLGDRDSTRHRLPLPAPAEQTNRANAGGEKWESGGGWGNHVGTGVRRSNIFIAVQDQFDIPCPCGGNTKLEVLVLCGDYVISFEC
jgi:hypothetical protein